MSLAMTPGDGSEDAIIDRLFSAGLDVHMALRLVRDISTATLLHEAVDLLDRAVRRVRNEAFDRQSREPQPVEPVH